MGSPCGKFLDTPLMRNLGGRKIIPATESYRNQMKFQRCPCELACCFAYERSLPVIAVCSRPAWDGAPRVVAHFYLSIHCMTPGDLGSASLSPPYRNTSQWSVIHVMLSVSLLRTCSILLHRPQRRVVPMWLNDTSVSSSTAFRYL